MKRIIHISRITLLILTLSAGVIFAQNNEQSDSTVLAHSKIEELNSKALEIAESDYSKALQLAMEALTLAKTKDLMIDIAQSNKTIGELYFNHGEHENALLYFLRAIDLFKMWGNASQEAGCAMKIARLFELRKEIDNARVYWEKAVTLCQENNLQQMLAESLEALAYTNYSLGNKKEAIDTYSRALNVKELLLDTIGMIQCINNMGIILQEQGNNVMAVTYFNRAMDLAESKGDNVSIATTYNNLANYYYAINQHDASIKAYLNSLEALKSTGNYDLISAVYNNLGMFHIEKSNYTKGILYIFEGLEIAKSHNLKNQMKQCYLNLADAYGKQNNYDKASEYHELYKTIADSGESVQTGHRIAMIDETYQNEKKDKEIMLLTKDNKIREIELERQKQLIYTLIGGSLLFLILLGVLIISNRSRKKANRLLLLQKMEIELKAEQLKQANRELEKLSIVAQETDNAVVITDGEAEIQWVNAGFTRLTGYTFEEFMTERGTNLMTASNNPDIRDALEKCIHYKKSIAYTTTSKTRAGKNIWVQTTITPILHKNNVVRMVAIDSDITKVKEAEIELMKKSELLSQTNKDLERKNLQITKSIDYAKLIQDAIMPSAEHIKKVFPQSFIFFRPKDIVSGDFYWFERINGKTIIALADCTGHGVPGAFMSMIGNTLLSDIVKGKKILDPSQILNELNKGIHDILYHERHNEIQSDGMDISVCMIDNDNRTATVASANQTVYLIDKEDIITYKGDLYSIGGLLGREQQISFTNQVFNLSEDTILYMLSDGYTDQFGGSENRKFMSSRFKVLLEKIREFPIEEQHRRVVSTFDNWKASLPQTDDVLVLAIKF